jgi:hypothetical protein
MWLYSEKEGPSMVLHSVNNGMYDKRFTIYKNDWDKTQKKAEEKLADAGFEQQTIQYVVAAMSDNYDRLMTKNGSSAAARKNSSTPVQTETPLEKTR